MTVAAIFESNDHEEEVVMNDVSAVEEEVSDDILSIPTFQEQTEIIKAALDKPLVIGETWYLLDVHWYNQWQKYIGCSLISRDNSSEHPGPVDNSPLFTFGSTKLKEHLLDECDYRLISESGWKKLIEWFRLAPEQIPVARKVIEEGVYTKTAKVEVYLLELKLAIFKDIENVIVKSYSKTVTLEYVVKDMKKIFQLPDDEETRTWNKFMTNTYEMITKLDNSIQEASISSGQMLVLEQKNENGEWPRPTRSRSLSSCSMSSPVESGHAPVFQTAANYSYSSTSRQRHLSMKPGLCGLSNLGNTCFMNSALQCLSNTTPLTKYFMSNTHKHELNPTNPLGMHGKIAEAYAELMQLMWGGHNSYVTPRQFKMQVGRFAPQFSGYQQQDSHELLAFLLDGLHEDLNRVNQKPYIELQDDKGRPDNEVAAEAWRNHSLRNSSVIVDHFHGQFKSTVECPYCQKKSVTFDPFCYLSLPLPIKKERNITVMFVPLDALKKPIRLKVSVPKLGCTTDLTSIVAKHMGTDPNKLIVTDVFGSKFHKRFEASDSLSHITDRDDIYIYEIPFNVANAEFEELLVLPVYLREITNSAYTYAYSYSSNSLFGTPMLVPVPRESTTAADLYQIILRSMRRFVNIPTVETQEADNLLKQTENKKDKDKDKEEEQQQEQEGKGEEEEEDKDTDMSGDESKIKEDSQEKECNDDGKEGEKKKEQLPATLFEMKVVNSSGSQDLNNSLKCDDKSLKLSSRMYLAIDWYPKLKKKYYDKKHAEEYEEHESLRGVGPSKKKILLSDCLDLFLQREKLGEDDPWYCPVCKEQRQAYKKFDLWTLPKILVIHLKRFSYNRYWRDKIDALVDFPTIQLDLSDYVINKAHPRAVYDLHAVSNHYGGLGGGHYTAYGKNCYDGAWHYFDDSSVSSADDSNVVSKAAYVLFYTRRNDPNDEMMNTSELLTEDTDVFEDDDDDENMEA